ncbi:hypothetical protein [Priestia megaterium]|uniref:hypothetical protein n=1 Tax=Priestia megaterium TaxID=1404 RepID=UPI0012940526|nr:hypothetical protein [Priestia megaterium]
MTKEQKIMEFMRKLENLEQEYNISFESESHHYNVFVLDIETDQLYRWDEEKV